MSYGTAIVSGEHFEVIYTDSSGWRFDVPRGNVVPMEAVMSVEWWQVPEMVTQMAEDLIANYHPSLHDARIAILFRSEAPITNGKVTLGQASKVTDRWRPLMKDMEMHFVIWLAQDRWDVMDKRKRRALLDHELCHCYLDNDGKAQLHPHDFEEFAVIIQRHGYWTDGLERLDRTIQGKLPLDIEPSGYVTTIGRNNDPIVDAETGEIASIFVGKMDHVMGPGNWSVGMVEADNTIPDVPEI